VLDRSPGVGVRQLRLRAAPDPLSQRAQSFDASANLALPHGAFRNKSRHRLVAASDNDFLALRDAIEQLSGSVWNCG
jgi:hypothetical protein